MIAAGVVLIGLAVPIAEEGLRRDYPWPPLAQGTMDCRPIDRTTLKCTRKDGKHYTCTAESASTVVCKEDPQ